jgi:ParB family transcriptional regulator, chromosome partitioning protein
MSSKKKRFGLGAALKGSLAETLTLGHTNEDSLNVEMVTLDRIEIDLDNPRSLGLNPTDPRLIADDDPDNEYKKKALTQLEGLAESIRAVGVQQPIKIYRHGSGFRIAFGERRYLASILAGKKSIPAIILFERPPHLRLLQYVENVQREDLSAWNRIQNIRAILEEHARFSKPIETAADLSRITGITRQQASTYFILLSAQEDVKKVLMSGAINSLEKAAQAARVSDPRRRREIIQAFIAGRTIESVRETQRAKKNEKGSGRKPTRVNLGSTRNLKVVRQIIESVVGENIYTDTDWNSYRSVSKTFKHFLRDLETGNNG